jgi:hypothetical protein
VIGATPARWRREHLRRGIFVEIPERKFPQLHE